MANPLALKQLQPLAKGNVRLVYEHPDDPDLLVKVMRPDQVSARYGEKAIWFRRGRRFDPYLQFVREIGEYVAAYASHGCSLPFAQAVRGLVETDLGLGLLTDAVRGPDGKLAPTAARLIQTGGFDETARTALETFAMELLESDLVVSDLHERNIVYASAPDGTRRFVMIDGLSSSNLLPFKIWFRSINRRSKKKRIIRLRTRIAKRVTAFLEGNPMP